jgi:hypothetical protein
MALLVLTPSQGDCQDGMDTPGVSHGNSLLVFRRPRSHGTSPGLWQTRVTVTGTRVLALVPCGSWRDAPMTLAPGAAHVTPGVEHGAVSPEARPQRRPQRARVFLQDLSRPALPQVHARAHGGAAGLLTAFPQGSLADRTGLGLPESGSALVPGSGGRAPQAGAIRMKLCIDNCGKCNGFLLLS